MATPIAGFISPPGWYDPSPSDFLDLAGGAARVQQCLLPLADFDWRIESIAETEPDLIGAARCLAAAGCGAVATVGTPFGWAGLDSAAAARQRCARVAQAAGVPNVAAGVAVLDALKAFGADKIGLACTYYSDDWRRQWRRYVEASGFEVLDARTLADDGLMPPHDAAEEAAWAPTADQVIQSVRNLVRANPAVQAVIISGAGARTLSYIAALEGEFDRLVVASDSALFWALAKTLGIKLRSGVLGRLGELA